MLLDNFTNGIVPVIGVRIVPLAILIIKYVYVFLDCGVMRHFYHKIVSFVVRDRIF